MQWVKARSAADPRNLPSDHSQNVKDCFASNDHHATVRNLSFATDTNVHPGAYQQPPPPEKSPRIEEEEANAKNHYASLQRYQIDRSSLRTRKRAWQEEQDDLNRVLDEERQAWSKRSHKDLRRMYNTNEAEQTSEKYNEELADTYTTSSREEISKHHHYQRRSNFMEGSMTEGSKAIASTWQASSFEDPKTLKVGIDEDSDLDATPRPSDADQASARSSFDINDFKPLPPTPSTLASTLKRLGQRFKPAETKQNLPQIFISDTKTLKNPRKGLRKSLSSWKIFNGSASETSDVESDYTDDLRPASNLRDKAIHSNPHQVILDERKRKAEIAYAEQFGTSRKRQKDNFGQRGTLRDQTCSDSEQATVRNRYRVSMSNLKAIPSAMRSDQPHANAKDLKPSIYTPTKQHCTGTTSHLSSLPRDTSLNFDSDIDRKKRRRRSYSALEKENQYLRQQLRASEPREATKRGSNAMKKSGNNITLNPTVLSSTASDKASKNPEAQSQDDESLGESTSSGRKHSTEPLNARQTPLSQEKVSRKSSGLEASELSQIIRETLPMPSVVRISSSEDILSPLSLNSSYRTDSETITYRSLRSPARKDSAFEIPRSLSMVLEGIEEDENGETGGKIGSCTVTGSDLTGETKFGHTVEPEPCKTEGKWEWPEDVF